MTGSELKRAPKGLGPQEALGLLEERLKIAQHELASRDDAGEDVLHYLAQNGAPATRRAVAANPAASARSNRLLADDIESGVRVELARKIGRLFPGLLEVEQKQLRELAIATLERLARDEEVAVRAMLASEIKSHACVPKRVARRLAKDREECVCLPIIEFSPVLDDRDLIELVATARAGAVLTAVARRKHVSENVSDAVAARLDIPAISALLANTDASIRTKTLDRIISQAADVAEWHAPLVVRAELSRGAIRRLASFVGSALIDALARHEGLDDGTRNHLKRKFVERKRRETPQAAGEAAEDASDADAALGAGTLDETFVAEAVDECHKETVVRALALLAKTDEAAVRRILDSRSARAATALAWRAGLSMRIALKIQTGVMRLSGGTLLPARDGGEFPMN
ncbi:MAG TPA: DUF2336 domain-containing protein, partial [Rhizomicrobium sp.]|nr:DUF2336 domain-containing protein [Rhizomicrobium sp.]